MFNDSSISNVFFPFLQLHVINDLAELLFVFFAADEQDIIVFHHNIIIEPLQHNQFIYRHIDNAIA
jgi:hypothetical protein